LVAAPLTRGEGADAQGVRESRAEPRGSRGELAAPV